MDDLSLLAQVHFWKSWTACCVQVTLPLRIIGFIISNRVVNMKGDEYYWYLGLTILCLGFEGIFTLAIKESQEWKFFCPSVFLYLARSEVTISHCYFSHRLP